MRKALLTAFFIANLGAIGGLWLYGSFSYLVSGAPGELFIGLGRLGGLLAEFLILIELLLISRVPFIEHTYGFDKLNKAHRWIGYGLLASILSHPLLLLFGYAAAQNLSLMNQIKDFMYNWEDVYRAIVGIGVVVMVGVASLPIIRRRMRYESWHVIHLFMYVALLLFFGHQTQTADVSFGWPLYYWLGLNYSIFGLLAIFRFVRPLWLYYRHRFYIEKVVQETPNVWSVYITGKSMESFLFDPGQYIHVLFWTRDMRQPHPFSLSQAYNGKSLRVSIKAVGDFTSRISSLTPGTPVGIEGPFGRFTKRAARTNKFTFIAGGIGITPIRSMIEGLGNEAKQATVLYGNRTASEVAFGHELEPLTHVIHIFSEEQKIGFEYGRVDKEKIIRLIPDISERDVYVCGPSPMMNSVIISLRALGVPKQRIHFEKFAY